MAKKLYGIERYLQDGEVKYMVLKYGAMETIMCKCIGERKAKIICAALNQAHAADQLCGNQFNNARRDRSVVFAKYSKLGTPQYLCTDDNQYFSFQVYDKYNYTCDLCLAFSIGNRIDQIPDSILDWCDQNGFVVREVLSTHVLTDPKKNPKKHQMKSKS